MVLRELINLIGYEIDEAAYKEVEGRSQALFNSIDKFGKEMSVKVTAPILAAAAFAVNEFTSYKTALALVAQTITGTESAAGKTADELDRMSSSLESHSLFEHNKILQDVTGTLLTFDKVTGATFDRASKGAVDLAARWKLDLQSAAIMVGKALNDPAEGLAMLTRRYVHMTKAEKDHVKALADAGRTADAQRYILDKLERSVGGAAQTVRDSSSGFIVFVNKLKEVGTTFGAILQPYFKKFYDILVNLLDRLESLSPTVKKTLLIFAALAAVIGPLAVALGAIGAIIPAIQGGLASLGSISGVLIAALGGSIATALGWVALIVAAVGVLFLLVEDFMTYMRGGDSIIGKFLAPWKEFGPAIIDYFRPVVEFFTYTWNALVELVRGVVQIIYGLITGNSDMVAKGITKTILGILNFVGSFIASCGLLLMSMMPILAKLLETLLIAIGKFFATVYMSAVKWVTDIVQTIIDKVKSIPLLGSILGGIGAAAKAVSGFGQMSSGGGTLTDATGFEARARSAWARPSAATSTTQKNVNVNSTIAMTVPAGTQQQQVVAVQQAAEQAVSFAFDKHLKQTLWQVAQ